MKKENFIFFIHSIDFFIFLALYLETHAAVAQSVEQGTENPRVISSILIGGTGWGCSEMRDNPFF